MKDTIFTFVYGFILATILFVAIFYKMATYNKLVTHPQAQSSSSSEILRLQEENAELLRRLANEQYTSSVAMKAYSDLNTKVAGIQTANDVGQYLGEYPEFLLLVLDKELDAVEQGKATYGSFSDYFVPIVGTAQLAGVPQVEINKRLDRVLSLAKQGKPLSTSVTASDFAEYIEELKHPVLVR